MSSGVFRGKESSNRIKLSRLVQDLLNFGVLGSLQLQGLGGGWVWVGVVGGCPLHTCTCMHMHAHTHMHIYTLNMIISIAIGSPHWRNPWEFPMMSYALDMCMCVHMCRGTLSPPPIPIHPPPPPGGDPGISQNSIALELIEIFQFCLKI